MIPILYEQDEMAFNSNGICRLVDAISCTVTEERNGIFECKLIYPVSGEHFDLIRPGRIIYCTHDETGRAQPFDIVGFNRNIDLTVTFHAVHISYRLLNIITSGKNINSLDDALQMLRNGAPENRFFYSADFTSSAYMAAGDGVPRPVRQMLGGVEGSILDTYGGEFEFDGFNVIIHRQRGVDRNLSIRYGVNLTGYNEEVDYSGVFTAAVPYWLGTDDQGNDLIVKGAQVDSPFIGYNGRTIATALDLSDKFETKPTAEALQSMAASIMSSQQSQLPAQNIEVDFVQLANTLEYVQYKQLLSCGLCDTVLVEFPAYKMAGRFKVVKTVYNALLDRYDSLELGKLSTSLAEALGIGQPSTEREGERLVFALAVAKKYWGSAVAKTDAATWRYLSHFSPPTMNDEISDPDAFGGGTDGFYVKEPGWYLCSLHVHYNTNTNPVALVCRILDVTKNTQVSVPLYNYLNGVSYGSMGVVGLYHVLTANTLICPQFEKYTNNTTTQWRPTTGQFAIVKLKTE